MSIVNWIKTKVPDQLPAKSRLWFQIEQDINTRQRRKQVSESSAKDYDLDVREFKHINSSLSDKISVSDAAVLACNESPQRTFVGVMSGHAGFVLSKSERDAMVAIDQRSAEVVFPYLIGRELASGDGTPKRWIIDFGDRNIIDARSYTAAFERVSATVLPDVKRKAEAEHETESSRRLHLERWWLHWRRRSEMKSAISELSGRFITGSRTQRWPFVFCFMSATVLPGDKMQVFAFDDDYSFGIMQGATHLLWYQAKAARLKNEEDYNYSAESVCDTFPWPQSPSPNHVEVVAITGRLLRKLRNEAASKIKGGLRALYSTLLLPGANPLKDAHAALDSAVMNAYGFSPMKDVLAQLLSLNQEVASRIERDDPITPRGIPRTYPRPMELRTTDCIKP